MKEVDVKVEFAGSNLSAYIEGAPIMTVGRDLAEVEKKTKEAVAVYLESCAELQIAPVELLTGDLNLVYKIDAATFINYYSNVFTKAALSRITGINERQLWHYAAGVHKPRRAQLEKIQRGVQALTKELQGISLM